MKDAEVQNKEESSSSDVSVPSSKDQSTQTEMSEMSYDQNSIIIEFELDYSSDVLDISDDMHYLFSEPEKFS